MKIKITTSQFLILAIIILAIALRVLVLFKIGDFTWDELFNFVYSQKSWIESIKIWQFETNPPLHLLFLKLWWFIFPTNEFWARLPSLVFGALGIYAIYFTVQKMFSRDVALIAALITAVCAPQIYASVLTRVYSALFLLATLSIYFFYKIFITKERSRPVMYGYILIQILLLFSHLTAVEVIAAEFFSLIFLRLAKQDYWLWIKLNAFPAVLWLIWIIPSLVLKFSNPRIGQAWFLNIDPPMSAITNLSNIVFFSPWLLVNLSAITIFSVVLIWTIIKITLSKQSLTPAFILILTYVATTVGFGVAYHLWNIKFFMVAFPGLIILLSYLAVTQTKKLQATLIFLLIALQFSGSIHFLNRLPISQWGGFNNLVSDLYQSNKKQAVLVAYFVDKLTFDHYYQGPMPPYYFMPFAPDQWEKQILTNNYNYPGYSFSAEQAQQWYKSTNLNNYEEIIVLEWELPKQHLTKEILEINGWKLKQSYAINIPIQHRVYDYVKN